MKVSPLLNAGHSHFASHFEYLSESGETKWTIAGTIFHLSEALAADQPLFPIFNEVSETCAVVYRNFFDEDTECLNNLFSEHSDLGQSDLCIVDHVVVRSAELRIGLDIALSHFIDLIADRGNCRALVVEPHFAARETSANFRSNCVLALWPWFRHHGFHHAPSGLFYADLTIAEPTKNPLFSNT